MALQPSRQLHEQWHLPFENLSVARLWIVYTFQGRYNLEQLAPKAVHFRFKKWWVVRVKIYIEIRVAIL